MLLVQLVVTLADKSIFTTFSCCRAVDSYNKFKTHKKKVVFKGYLYGNISMRCSVRQLAWQFLKPCCSTRLVGGGLNGRCVCVCGGEGGGGGVGYLFQVGCYPRLQAWLPQALEPS